MTSNQTTESGGSRLPAPRRCGISCFLMAIVFVSGILAGGGLTVIFELDETVTKLFGLKQKSRSIAELRDRITDRYAIELGLSGEQTEKLREIFGRHLADSLQRRINILDKVTAELAPLLNDAQKAKWVQVKAERIKKWGEGMATTKPAE